MSSIRSPVCSAEISICIPSASLSFFPTNFASCIMHPVSVRKCLQSSRKRSNGGIVSGSSEEQQPGIDSFGELYPWLNCSNGEY